MHEIKSFIINTTKLTILTLLLSNCESLEDFSDIPRIEFASLEFIQAPESNSSGPQQADQLLLTISFQDGNGDLGIGEDEIYYPFHDYDLVVDSNTRVVTLGRTDLVPPLRRVQRVEGPDDIGWFGQITTTYDSSSTITLPALSCEDYEFLNFNQANNEVIAPGRVNSISNPSAYPVDTLLKVENEFRNNFIATFLIDENETGDFIEVEWPREAGTGCSIDYSGRFPILGQAFEGTISYRMASAAIGGFDTRLAKGLFRIRCYIYDRSLNQSNIIETPAYRLSDLQGL